MTPVTAGLVAGFCATVVRAALTVARRAVYPVPDFDSAEWAAGTKWIDSSLKLWGVRLLVGTVFWGLLFAWIFGTSNCLLIQYLRDGVLFGVLVWLAGQGFRHRPLLLVLTLVMSITFGMVLGVVYAALVETPRACL